jgi:hypothetical protein
VVAAAAPESARASLAARGASSGARQGRFRSTITVRATISSPAGVPQGNCLIQNQLVPLKDGHCSQRLRLGRGRKQTVGVSFVPEDGWLGAEGHRNIRLVG